MHDDLFQIENKFKGALNLILWNSQVIFHMFWRSHFIFALENHWVAWSFWIRNIFKWYSNIFNTPFHLNKWKKSCHLLSRVLWWKEFEFMEIIMQRESLGKSFHSLSFNFHFFFQISLNFTQAIIQSIKTIYLI